MVSFHVAGAVGRDKVIIRIDFRDDDFFVLYVVSFHVAGAAGRDKVIRAGLSQYATYAAA